MSALTTEEVLTTTRCVRRRLDLGTPVDPDVITDCLRIAQQAPSGSNLQLAHMVVVTDPDKRAALAGIWRRAAEAYQEMDASVYKLTYGDQRDADNPRLIESFEYMMDHLGEVPVHVVPCIAFRPPADPGSKFLDAVVWGSIFPFMWSFMLAARSKGLASCLTTIHNLYEEEAAEVLGIPYPDVMQAGLIPVAHSIGQDYKPAYRVPVDTITHHDIW
jgi:nitroreductase